MDELEPRDGPREGPSLPPLGSLIRQVALGTEATYRVIGENARGVEVEVVDAPGLEPGARFTFTLADVIKMTDPEGERADHAVRHEAPKRRYA